MAAFVTEIVVLAAAMSISYSRHRISGWYSATWPPIRQSGNTVARFAGRARRHLQCCGDARLLLVCTSASAARQGRVTELGEKIAQKICRPLRRSILGSGSQSNTTSGRPHDAAKTSVAVRSIDRFRLARRRPVAQAVVGCAQVRAPFHQPAGGVSARLARHTAGFSGYFAAVRGEAGSGPLPHIPDHVVEAIAVCGKGIDRRGALVAVELEVLPGETALPRVGHCPPVRRNRFAPRVSRAVESAAGGEFPFGLDR